MEAHIQTRRLPENQSKEITLEDTPCEVVFIAVESLNVQLLINLWLLTLLVSVFDDAHY